MKTIAVIPARLQSTRLPRKMLRKIGKQTLIELTYRNLKAMELFDKILVATDAEEIRDVLQSTDADVYMSKRAHECGSDRIAEAVEDMDVDVVVNVQGDEPFVRKEDLAKLVEAMRADQDNIISLGSLMHAISDEAALKNPNNVKVVTDSAGKALYFSRAGIPFNRDGGDNSAYKHVGVYAFRKSALMEFYRSPMGKLEAIEKIECLRYLENGHSIQMILIDQPSIGIDTEDDLLEARKLLEENF